MHFGSWTWNDFQSQGDITGAHRRLRIIKPSDVQRRRQQWNFDTLTHIILPFPTFHWEFLVSETCKQTFTPCKPNTNASAARKITNDWNPVYYTGEVCRSRRSLFSETAYLWSTLAPVVGLCDVPSRLQIDT